MKDDTILKFADPAGISPDPLTEILRKGARDLLAQAVEAELCDLLAKHAHLTYAAGRQRLVRHGHCSQPPGRGLKQAFLAHQGRELLGIALPRQRPEPGACAAAQDERVNG